MGGVRRLLPFPRSVQGRLLLQLLMVLVPVLLLGLASYYDRYDDGRQQEREDSMELGRAVAAAFDDYVQGVLRQELAIGLALSYPQPMPPEQANLILSENARQYATIRWFNWLSPEGRALASSDPQAIGTDFSDRAYFKEVIAGKDWTVSDLLQARVGGQPTFMIVRAFRDGSGALQGIVVGGVEPGQLAMLALPMQRFGEGAVTIIDRRGRIVYRRVGDDPPWERRDLTTTAGPLLHSALDGQEVTGTYRSEIDGQNRTGAFIPIRDYGWVVRVDRPQAETELPVLTDLLRDAGFFLLLALGGFLIALLTSRTVTGPVARLKAHAVALGEGQIDRQITVTGPAELEQLADTFNSMATAIKTQREDLVIHNEELHAQQEALQRLLTQVQFEQERWQATVESMLDPVTVCDAAGRAIYMNSAYSQLVGLHIKSGLTLDEHPGYYRLCRPDGTLFAPEDLPLQRAALRDEEVRNVEIRQYTPDGEACIVLWHASPLHDGDGRVIGAVAVGRDVTEQRKAEQFREEYVSLISHDLRNPLTVLMGRAGLLLRALQRKSMEQEMEDVEAILGSARRMNDMLRDLLETTRLEAGQFELRKEPGDLAPLIRATADQIGSADDRARIRIECPDPLPPVPLDAQRIERAIANLLTNALKYSPPEAPVIVRLALEEGSVVVSVSDRGVGIAHDDLQYLFMRYYRAKTGRKTEGLGLGLYITRLIMEAHGGRIWVESEEGAGSTFCFALPLGEALPP